MTRIRTILDIMTYCIALIGYAPLSPFLETVPRAVLPAAIVCGFLADRKGKWLGGSLPTIVSILFFIFYAARLSMTNLVEPSVNLLALLLAIRLVSEKKVRNYLQIFALSLFCLAGSSLFTLDALFMVYLIVLIFLVAVALVVLTFHGSDNRMVLPSAKVKSIMSFACLIPAAALPLMCLFFVILPRTQYPLWNFLNAAGSKVTGFSEKVEPGNAASVGESRNAVFRARCRKLPKEQLYWRGRVFKTLEGKAWIEGNLPEGEEGLVPQSGTVPQTIYPEQGEASQLFALNAPVSVTGIRGGVSGDLVLKSRSVRRGRIRYDVVSASAGVIRTRGDIDRSYYLLLPTNLSPRMVSAGMEIAANGRTDEEKVELLKEFFRSWKIAYATSDLPVSADPLDEFLFVKKRGNCEFFASSFALLLRAAGIPSRLVGGYLGGEYNDMGGYYLVTEDLAHVWVEAYISGAGWVTVDPSSLSAGFRRFEENRQSGVAYRIGLLLDGCNYYWNRAVISYDLEKQFRLVRDVNSHIRQIPLKFRPGRFIPWLAALLILTVLIFTAARSMGVTREERLVRRFLRILEKKYVVEISPSTGLLELAEISGAPSAKRFADIYCRAVYGDRKLTTEEYRLLEGLLRTL